MVVTNSGGTIVIVNVSMNIVGAQTPENRLMKCRAGVCVFRVRLIVRTTCVRAEPPVVVAMSHLSEFVRPTALVKIPLLTAPLTGRSLLATGVRLTAEALEIILLLRLTCLLGPMCMCVLSLTVPMLRLS